MERFDLVVIGAGPGGCTAAKAAALKGMRVALVSRRREDMMGYGLEGAYKSKALYEIAREHHVMRCRWNLPLAALNVDFPAFCEANRTGAADLREAHREQCERLGIEVVFGHARLAGPHRVVAGDRELEAERVVIATGTSPRTVPGIEVDGAAVVTSDEIVCLDRRPRSLVVLGAGVIGCEFASIFAALGVEVTLLDTRERILSHEDEDVGALVQRSFEHLGMTILPSVRCTSMRRDGDRVVTALKDGREITSEMALVAIGRQANTRDLGLEAAGVELDARGFVPVDDQMRTNVPHIYAAGDVGVRATPLDLSLVHVAEAEARRAVAHMCGEAGAIETTHVPFIVFTLPMVAGAGDNEAIARERLGSVRVGKFANQRNHRAHARGSRSGFVKLIVGPEGDDRVYGVRGVGDGVDTVIGEASLMIQNGLPYTHLLDAIHAHPSLSESLHGAAQIIASGALPYQPGEENARDWFIDPGG